MSNDLERRFTSVRVECRAAAKSRTIGGYAAKFNTRSQNLGGFVETIAPGFFNDSAARGWPGVIARYNHDDNMLLGTTAAETLRLSIDGTGLLYEADTPETRNDVLELVQRGDVSQSSFAFATFEDEWSATEDGFPLRTLISGRLYDVAPVNTPAYDDTSVGLRSLAKKFDADIAEVQALASANDLRRFFVRTDVTEKQERGAVMSAANASAIAKALSITSI